MFLTSFPPAGCPEEADEPIDHPLLEELILLSGLYADKVHAVSPADIPARDPVHLQLLGQFVLPAEEVAVAAKLCVFDPVGTVLRVGQTEGPCGGVPVLGRHQGGQE